MNQIQELSFDEIEQVDGGIIPLIVGMWLALGALGYGGYREFSR